MSEKIDKLCRALAERRGAPLREPRRRGGEEEALLRGVSGTGAHGGSVLGGRAKPPDADPSGDVPSVKTLEQFDFEAAPGAPKARLQELAGVAFIERRENVILLGPAGPGRRI